MESRAAEDRSRVRAGVRDCLRGAVLAVAMVRRSALVLRTSDRVKSRPKHQEVEEELRALVKPRMKGVRVAHPAGAVLERLVDLRRPSSRSASLLIYGREDSNRQARLKLELDVEVALPSFRR